MRTAKYQRISGKIERISEDGPAVLVTPTGPNPHPTADTDLEGLTVDSMAHSKPKLRGIVRDYEADASKLDLCSRLASLNWPDEDLIPHVGSADGLLELLVLVSDNRGRYYAEPPLVLRFLYRQDPRPTLLDFYQWRDELIARGDITITPDSVNCYGMCVELVANIQALHRFQRWANRPAIPKAVRDKVFENDSHACVTCGATEPLEVDHIVPWSKGGAHDITNFQTLCKPCNSSKGARV